MTNPDGATRPTRVRHVVVFTAMVMSVLLYLDRFCVSFAADYIREDLRLSQNEMGWFLSAFFWSYALAQVPSGWLSDRYGARLMLAIYVLSWSFFTAMIGAVTSFALLVLMRLGTGLGQAGAYPTSASVVSKWVPFASRGTASSLIAFGGRIGGAIAPLLTAWLMVLFVPMDVPVEFDTDDLLDPPRLCAQLMEPNGVADTDSERVRQDSVSTAKTERLTMPSAAGRYLASLLPEDVRRRLAVVAARYRNWERGGRASTKGRQSPGERAATPPQLSPEELGVLLAGLNGLLDRPELYDEEAFREARLTREAVHLLRQAQRESLSSQQNRRLNRLLLEGAFPGEIGKLYVEGWRPVMVVYGTIGLLVAGLIWLFFRSRPEQHPWCNQAECELIARDRPAGAPGPHGKPGMVPLGRLLTSRSMWFICAMQWGTNVGWVFLVTWLPRYLLTEHRVPILERGMMAFVPLAVGIVGMLAGGRVTDWLVPRIGLRWGRRLPMMLTRFSAACGYGLCLLFASEWGEAFFRSSWGAWIDRPWAFTAALSLVAFSTDLGTASTWAFNQDVGGRYVGSILGWGNMWGNLGAAVSPPIYDYFLGEQPSTAEWNAMFVVCAAAFVLAGLCAAGVDATIPIAPPDEAHDDADETA